MANNETKHEHPGGDIPHRHAETDELATHASQTGSLETHTDAERTVQLREEELLARKQSVETGRVRVGKDVVEEEQTLQVPVTREEVTIERHAVDRRPSDRPIGESESINVPVHEDRVQLEKQAVVYEEVSVGKRAVEETQHVKGTVRREEAVIDGDGDVVVEGESESSHQRRP